MGNSIMLSEEKWYRLNDTNVGRLPHSFGCYELAGKGAVVVYIGWAGRAGLQEKIRSHISDPENLWIAANAFSSASSSQRSPSGERRSGYGPIARSGTACFRCVWNQEPPDGSGFYQSGCGQTPMHVFIWHAA